MPIVTTDTKRGSQRYSPVKQNRGGPGSMARLATEENFEKVLDVIGGGGSLVQAAAAIDVSDRVIQKWIENDVDGFFGSYRMARRSSVEQMLDEIKQLSDGIDIETGKKHPDWGTRRYSRQVKLQIHTRMWLVERLAPDLMPRADTNVSVNVMGDDAYRAVIGMSDDMLMDMQRNYVASGKKDIDEIRTLPDTPPNNHVRRRGAATERLLTTPAQDLIPDGHDDSNVDKAPDD